MRCEPRRSIATEEPAPSFGEAWRMVWKVEVLRRIWYAIPFLAVSLIGFVSLAGLLYDQVYRYGDFQAWRDRRARRAVPARRPDHRCPDRHPARRAATPALVFRFLR